MQAALAEHPEWEGDWEMPAGVDQVEIDPKTGEVATPEVVDKRVELFLNGTGPNVEAAAEEASPEEQEQASPEPNQGQTQPLPLVSPSPSPPHAKPAASPPDARLEGTITLDIDPTTGLIAVESCPVVRTKTFVLGTEPRRYCGPEYHKLKTVDPATRPRAVTSPSPR